jgi:catechol 2,3-dioxygenase-like lactoylglutathione lyase family enzyme
MAIFVVQAANMILYCSQWQETVRFYRDLLGLPVRCARDWFVEFQVMEGSFLSIADAARTTIVSSRGNGITLSLKVTDLDQAHRNLTTAGIAAGPIRNKWGARVFYFHDPEGHRLEAWA